MKKFFSGAAAGLGAGVLNGLFGAGGGMAAVPMLQQLGCPPREAHATSLAIILPLTLLSLGLYLRAGTLSPGQVLPYLPGGLAGAAAGSLLLRRIRPIWVHRIFGALVLFAAGRLLLL